jgi:hypothetical protein
MRADLRNRRHKMLELKQAQEIVEKAESRKAQPASSAISDGPEVVPVKLTGSRFTEEEQRLLSLVSMMGRANALNAMEMARPEVAQAIQRAWNVNQFPGWTFWKAENGEAEPNPPIALQWLEYLNSAPEELAYNAAPTEETPILEFHPVYDAPPAPQTRQRDCRQPENSQDISSALEAELQGVVLRGDYAPMVSGTRTMQASIDLRVIDGVVTAVMVTGLQEYSHR